MKSLILTKVSTIKLQFSQLIELNSNDKIVSQFMLKFIDYMYKNCSIQQNDNNVICITKTGKHFLFVQYGQQIISKTNTETGTRTFYKIS